MKYLLSNGTETTTISDFIEDNRDIFGSNHLDISLGKQLINPFEMILFEIVNKTIIFTRMRRMNTEEIIYKGK